MDSQHLRQMQKHSYISALDDDLVCICQGGDQRAFGELMRRYRSVAFKIACSILRDKHEAEDEVQNAFWKAYEHISQFNRDSKFSTWLSRIVVNQCLMRLRVARRARFTFIDEVTVGDESITLELPDLRQSPERELGRAEIAAVLDREINRTPPLLRHVLLLRDVQHKPMTEVAEILGISVAAAKSRLLRARAELRSRLSKHCGRVGPATLTA